ncbi:protein FAM185A-like isoform X2 [Mytilus californianus]|nr:protein FAM185A-like isoform X2 [Mytilus californianus]
MSVTGAGSISTDRIQGQTIKCTVEEGNISATSVYSTDSEFTCNNGNINLMNTHGISKTTVNKGNLIIDSLDGSLEAKVNNGSTDIFISRPDVITIETETGDINIKIPETSTSLDLEGNSVTCDQKLNIIEKKTESIKNKEKLSGYLSGTDGKIKAITKDGGINVKCLDWMESLKLKGFSAD